MEGAKHHLAAMIEKSQPEDGVCRLLSFFVTQKAREVLKPEKHFSGHTRFQVKRNFDSAVRLCRAAVSLSRAQRCGLLLLCGNQLRRYPTEASCALRVLSDMDHHFLLSSDTLGC